MRIGVTFNLRQAPDGPVREPAAAQGRLGLPRDDSEEEFDSPATVAALAEVLQSLGHEVELLGDGEPLVRRLLEYPRLDLVWNTAEGTGRERTRESRVPALLEMLRIPYTGSDPLALAATLDKDCAKRLVASHGVATPRWLLASDGGWPEFEKRLSVANLVYPLIAKPAFEGSSKGIVSNSVVDDRGQLRDALAELQSEYGPSVLVEEFIDGDELTVGLLGNDPPDVLGVMRIRPRHRTGEPFVYGLEVKRNFERLADYECPAGLSPGDQQGVRGSALAAWQALGCRDVARIDFRLRAGVPYFLEANPLPGLSPKSGDLVILCGRIGIEYRELVARILAAAIRRLNLADQPAPLALAENREQ